MYVYIQHINLTRSLIHSFYLSFSFFYTRTLCIRASKTRIHTDTHLYATFFSFFLSFFLLFFSFTYFNRFTIFIEVRLLWHKTRNRYVRKCLVYYRIREYYSLSLSFVLYIYSASSLSFRLSRTHTHPLHLSRCSSSYTRSHSRW